MAGFIILSALLVASDLRTMRLPDSLVLSIWGLGIVRVLLLDLPLIDAIVSTTVLFFVMRAFKHYYAKARGREGIGLGDVKLIAALGPWVDPFLLPEFLMCIGLAGGMWALGLRLIGRRGYFPYAPSIFLGYLLTSNLVPQGTQETLFLQLSA